MTTYKTELNDIIYRELLVVGSPNLIERYNRALERLTGKRTALTLFHIDRTGYSPEIAEEFDDEDYLDNFGINKKFIIISIAQKDLPIVRTHFSSTGEFIKEFIEDNHESILTLSALDSIFGELENNIHRIESIEDVIAADKVELHIETTKQLLDTANHLNECIGRLNSSDIETWLNDSSLIEIAELAKRTGNIQHNSIIPTKTRYTKDIYYTSHYGGLYVFKNLKENSLEQSDAVHMIYMDEAQLPAPVKELSRSLSNVKIINGSSIKDVYSFLIRFGLIEDIVGDELTSRKDRMRMKKYQVIVDYLSVSDEHDINSLNRFNIKAVINEHFDTLPDTFHQLYRLMSSIDRDQHIIEKEDETLFYTCKVGESEIAQGNGNLINHLISNYTPYSYMRLLTYNNERFTGLFETWADSKKMYVVRYLQHQLNLAG